MAHTARLPDPLDEYWDWQRLAACRTLPDSLFFHPDAERDPSRSRRVDRAKAICDRCPVRRECLEHSLNAEEPYGTWGGVDERQRRVLLLGRRGAGRRSGDPDQAPAACDDPRGA